MSQLTNLQRCFVIANPCAHSGAGAQAAELTRRFLSSYHSICDSFDFHLTQHQGHAAELAEKSAGYDTCLVLGGDGVIHEAINGLMRISREQRPCLAVIPYGSGNDFAQTCSLTQNNVDQALHDLLEGKKVRLDLGQVNEYYFMETLSFGLDAKIAHDTIKRRQEGTTEKGKLLFISSALRMLPQANKRWSYSLSCDDAQIERGESLIFAVQVGPSYGGGFLICPGADPQDGLLDLCYSVGKPSLASCLKVLGQIRFGKHTNSRFIKLTQARNLNLSFDEEIPGQMDGELLFGKEFTISVLPGELECIVGKNFRSSCGA